MTLHEPVIVNPTSKYARAPLIAPTTLGYLLIAAEVQPRQAPFLPNGREKTALLTELQEIAQRIEELDDVEKVTLFDGIAFAPANTAVRQRLGAAGIPRFDLVALIETTSLTSARTVQATREYDALLDALRSRARRLYVAAARDAKRIGDVDKARRGTFLFNFFVGDDPEKVLELWDYLAGWYAVETGLDNSTLLVPLEGERSEFVAINNARWDAGLLRVFFQQLSRASFRTYLLANMEANQVGALPMLYRRAGEPARAANRALAVALPVALAASALAVGAGIAWRRGRARAMTPRLFGRGRRGGRV